MQLESMKALQDFIKVNFKEFQEDDNNMRVGYVEPGHGWKGKQQWINTDKDLSELYSIYNDVKKYILLWCYLPTNKKRKSATSEPASKRARCAQINLMMKTLVKL